MEDSIREVIELLEMVLEEDLLAHKLEEELISILEELKKSKNISDTIEIREKLENFADMVEDQYVSSNVRDAIYILDSLN
jgi:hypothetical protein